MTVRVRVRVVNLKPLSERLEEIGGCAEIVDDAHRERFHVRARGLHAHKPNPKEDSGDGRS